MGAWDMLRTMYYRRSRGYPSCRLLYKYLAKDFEAAQNMSDEDMVVCGSRHLPISASELLNNLHQGNGEKYFENEALAQDFIDYYHNKLKTCDGTKSVLAYMYD